MEGQFTILYIPELCVTSISSNAKERLAGIFAFQNWMRKLISLKTHRDFSTALTIARAKKHAGLPVYSFVRNHLCKWIFLCKILYTTAKFYHYCSLGFTNNDSVVGDDKNILYGQILLTNFLVPRFGKISNEPQYLAWSEWFASIMVERSWNYFTMLAESAPTHRTSGVSPEVTVLWYT